MIVIVWSYLIQIHIIYYTSSHPHTKYGVKCYFNCLCGVRYVLKMGLSSGSSVQCIISTAISVYLTTFLRIIICFWAQIVLIHTENRQIISAKCILIVNVKDRALIFFLAYNIWRWSFHIWCFSIANLFVFGHSIINETNINRPVFT